MKIITTVSIRVESDSGGDANVFESTRSQHIGGNPRFVAHETEQLLIGQVDNLKTRVENEYGVRS